MCAYTPSAASVSHRRTRARTHNEEILVNESLRGCRCLRSTVLIYALSSWAKNKDHTEWGATESYKTQFKVTCQVHSRQSKSGFHPQARPGNEFPDVRCFAKKVQRKLITPDGAKKNEGSRVAGKQHGHKTTDTQRLIGATTPLNLKSFASWTALLRRLCIYCRLRRSSAVQNSSSYYSSFWNVNCHQLYILPSTEMNQDPHKATAETSDKLLFLFFFAIVFFTFCARLCHLILTGTTCNSNFIEWHIHTPYNNTQRYYTTGSDIDYGTQGWDDEKHK